MVSELEKYVYEKCTPFWQMKVTLKIKTFDFFEEIRLWYGKLNFCVYLFSSKCFHFSDDFFIKEVIQKFFLKIFSQRK